MAIITVSDMQHIPEVKNQPEDYLEFIATGVDAIIKQYCKRDIESATYTEYYDGQDTHELVLRSTPVTAITGVWVHQGGFYGLAPGAFPSTTEITEGANFVRKLGKNGICNSGILIRVSGLNAGFTGWYPEHYMSNKLAASRLPIWPFGQGNIKVTYTAGYATIPKDLKIAGAMIVAGLAKDLPLGGRITSESLGAYSYTLDRSTDFGRSSRPEIASVANILGRYRRVYF